MPRVSQKLLILFLIFFSFFSALGEAREISYKFSLTKDSLGRSLERPCAVFFSYDTQRLYVADFFLNALLSYNKDGKPLKSFNAAGKLKGPKDFVRNGEILWVIERPFNSLTYINLKKHIFLRNKLSYEGRPLLPDKILLRDKDLILLDRSTGQVFWIEFKPQKNKISLKIKKVWSPKEKDFKGFRDIKIKGNILWGLEDIRGRIFSLNLKTNKQSIFRPKASIVLPISLEIDDQGNFYLLDRDLKKVFVFDKKGNLRYTFLKEGPYEGEVLCPTRLLWIGARLFIIDEGNGRIDVWGH